MILVDDDVELMEILPCRVNVCSGQNFYNSYTVNWSTVSV